MARLLPTMQDMTEKAVELGFELIGRTTPEPLFEWGGEVEGRIKKGLIPKDAWSRRGMGFEPKKLMPDVERILILVRSHKPFAEPFPSGIAAYSAHYREYPIGQKSAVLFVRWLQEMGINAVLTSKLPLKALAVKAGLGTYGRNSLVYAGKLGSFITLYGILIDKAGGEDTLPSASQRDQGVPQCGECDICVRQCPTGAIRPNAVIDHSRCIRNYMGSGELVPPGIREAYGVRLLGCEICQRVCPRNAHVLNSLSLPPDEEFEMFSLATLLGATQASWKEASKDIVEIIGKNYARRARVLGDATIAAGCSKDTSLLEPLKEALRYPHVPVRAHSAWAIGRIGTPEAKEILREALQKEGDPQVICEIQSAMASITGRRCLLPNSQMR